MSNQPSWYRILRYWDEKEGRTGLSFSFLVGATRDPIGNKFDSKEEAKEYSQELYDEMEFAYIDGFSTFDYGCDTIGGTAIKLEYMRSKGLDVSFDELWEFYGEAIVQGKYSCCLGKFSEMGPEDIGWIRKALS